MFLLGSQRRLAASFFFFLLSPLTSHNILPFLHTHHTLPHHVPHLPYTHSSCRHAPPGPYVSLSSHLPSLGLPGVRRFSPFRHGCRPAPGRAGRPTLWQDTPRGCVASTGMAPLLATCRTLTQPLAAGGLHDLNGSRMENYFFHPLFSS